jgi:hypothetical protein
MYPHIMFENCRIVVSRIRICIRILICISVSGHPREAVDDFDKINLIAEVKREITFW